MAQITRLAKAELAEIREHQAEMSERLITNYRSVLGCLDPRNAEAADAAAVLRLARRTVADAGGFEAQPADIEAVAAHHANNYMARASRRRPLALRRRSRLTSTLLGEIVSFTVQHSARLRAVMRWLGMRHDCAHDFDRPHVDGDRVHRHVLYRLR